MPRKRLSEFRAKTMVHRALGLPYRGWSIDAMGDNQQYIQAIQESTRKVVVKVDQGIKGRFKKGLVLLNVMPENVPQAIEQLAQKGYRWLLVEPQSSHSQSDERYISLTYDRSGLVLHYSAEGGVDIEAHPETIKHVSLVGDVNWAQIAGLTGFTAEQLQALVALFDEKHLTFLEINPYFTNWMGVHMLDLAIEVDDAAAYFVDDWSEADIRSTATRQQTPEELSIVELAEKSPASFKLELINPDGAIFLLLSGGGASIVVADEVYNQGHGAKLANYGEYSGNPNTEETYLYTSAVLRLLLQSKAKKKVVFIGGAVANFTDIASTFTGIIQAINEAVADLQRHGVKVYVRRGGPRQEVGLAKIEHVLRQHGLLGAVHNPSTPLTAAVSEALQEVA